MSRKISIVFAAAIVMSALAAMSSDMTTWRALDGSDRPAPGLLVGQFPSIDELMVRKRKLAWFELAGKNLLA